MADFETITIPELDTLVADINTLIEASNATGSSGKMTLAALSNIVAPYVASITASGLVFPNSGTPTVLPNPVTAGVYATILGAGTYTQTTGSNITATGLINILSRVGGVWFLVKEIFIPITHKPSEQPFKNRFNKNTTVHQGYVDAGSGTLQTTTTLEISRSAAIDVYGLNNLTISGLVLSPGFNAWVFQTESGAVLTKGVLSNTTTTLPVPASAKYFYFNTQFNVGADPSFYNTIQVESGINASPYEPFYSEELVTVFGYPVPKVNIITKTGPSKNRFNKAAIVNDYYVDTTSGEYVGPYSPSGQIAVSGDIDVSGLSSISFSGLVNATYGGVNAYQFIGSSGSVLSHGGITTTSGSLSVPSGAVIFRFNVKFQNPDTSFYNTIQVEAGSSITSYEPYGFIEYVDKINGVPIPTAAQSSGSSTVSPLSGLTMTVEGDSIMEQDIFLAEVRAMTGVLTNIKAKSGSGYVMNSSGTIRSRASEIASTNPKIILIAGGTNDYGENKPLGTVGVINDDTQFYSAVYNTFRVIREQNQLVPIIVFTPIQRYYHPRSEVRGTVNALGLSLSQYCDMIKIAAAIFSIPVVDQYSESGITFENIDQTTSDGVHVIQYGGRLMARQAVPVLNKNVS